MTLKSVVIIYQDLKSMEQQKEKIEQDYLASVEKLKERQEEIRQLHKVRFIIYQYGSQDSCSYNYFADLFKLCFFFHIATFVGIMNAVWLYVESSKIFSQLFL